MAASSRSQKSGIAKTITVQEGDGCYTMTVPKDAARELRIEGGDTILVTVEEGDQVMSVRPFSPDLLD